MASRAYLCAGLVLVLAAASGVRAEVEYTDMQRWAGLLAQSFLAHSNDKAQAHTQLGLFKSLVNDKLALAAAGKDFHSQDITATNSYQGAGGVAASQAGAAAPPPTSKTFLDGLITVNDPALYIDGSSKIANVISGLTVAAQFLAYSPCLILTQPYGFGVFANGVNIQPTGVYVAPTAFNVEPQGFNVAPTLIYVGPIGKNIGPQGFNVAPALISVAPVYNSVGTPGKDLSGDPRIKTVTLPRDGVGEVQVTYPGEAGSGDASTTTSATQP